MLRLLLLPTLLVSLASPASAADPQDLHEWIHGGCKHGHELARRVPPDIPIDRATRAIDVLHVELDFDFPTPTNLIDATMQARLVVLEDATTVDFDLESDRTASLGLTVSRAWVDGAGTTFVHQADTLRVDLPTPLAAGDTTTVVVEYGGRPIEGRFPGYGLRLTNYIDEEFQNDPSRPVIQTLSQPTGARTWWPSHDHPGDQATVRLRVACPPGFVLAAPGIVESTETLGDGRLRQTNFMPHPIPSYLVSMIVADLERWTESVEVTELLPGGTTQTRAMDLVYFAPSTRRADAEFTWANTAEMLRLFEGFWGPYPYADVKYGNAVFQGSVAMEHATLSSIGDSPFTLSSFTSSLYDGPSGELVNAHELAHQWFGDAVTVDRWGDIWLNEGFARYAEVLWLEDFYGAAEARAYMDQLRESRDLWTGTLRDPDGLFSLVTYNRGALTLHMLRQVMGREPLFTAMRNYVTDPDLRYGSVTTEDFQAHCEAVHGQSLDWFFDPWTTRERLPSVAVQWVAVASGARIEIQQDPDNVYTLLLPVRLRFDDGTTQDDVALVAREREVVVIEAEGRVVGVEIDPEGDWLVEVGSIVEPRVDLLAARPNPFNAGTRITYDVSGSADVAVEIFDVRGRRVWGTRIPDAPPGEDFVLWEGTNDDGDAVSSGVYYVQLEGAGRTSTTKITLVR